MLKLVGVAGTFGPLHKGHEVLLRKAFEVGEKVLVALTTDEMHANKKYKEKIQSTSTQLSLYDWFLGSYDIYSYDSNSHLIR